MWATINEPWVVMDGGYLHGALAPGHRNLFEAPIVLHHLLRAHAAAVAAYRASGRHAIGLVVNIEPKEAASGSPEDLAAGARAEGYMNRLALDPVLLGSYPAELAAIFGEAWPDPPAADLEQIRQPLDFLGINYYTRGVTRHDPRVLPVRASTVRQPRHAYTETGWGGYPPGPPGARRGGPARAPHPRHAYTETGWEVYPQGLADALLWCRRRYGALPIYVTENGAAFYDPPTANGGVDDPLRRGYLGRR